MPGNDDKKYYRNPEYTNEGLQKEIVERKRPTGPTARRPTGEYDLDPIKGEGAANLDLEKRMDEIRKSTEEESPDKKRTLHDPKKFEELMKERIAQTQPPEVQRITDTEIEALRLSGLRSNSDDVRAKQKVNAFFQNVSSTIGSMFSSQKKNTMCENYGHIAPASWKGDFPKCTECGKLITAQSELRKSSANQKTVDIKPHDNRLEL